MARAGVLMPWTTPETFTAGQTLTAASMNAISGNLNALTGARRLGYQTRTTNYTIDQTAIASATDIFTSDITWTADGTSTYWVEFYCSRLVFSNTVGQSISLVLVDGSGTGLGSAALLLSGSSIGNQVNLYARVPYTPAAGSRSVNFRSVYVAGAATSVFGAGSGGTSAFDSLPMWMAVYGPETTNA